ncbi:glycosyltransferase, group 2 family protein [Oesophagostomum dentatum]|uniref:Glycosyltransferase, group 2 family protein n=1 Tax=Oesophagostomum dentatum TaxID=61180 RepID=A0A0B1T8F3_OESDE|nr:glycosyltransferase, group 2 family protein [Oesophagostomum dentatum]
MRMLVALLLCSVALLCRADDKDTEKKEEEPKLPRCPHVNPYKKLEEWLKYTPEKCNHTTLEDELVTEEEKEYHKFGLKSFAFDILASDRLGVERNPGAQAHELCGKEKFDAEYATSVIIVHHNEGLSILLRMLKGIFERTPEHLLHEVILYEDASEEEHQLTKYLEKFGSITGYGKKMRIIRSEERQGLIRAKTLASREAKGDVLVFMDSHCEVTERWLEPLLAPIKENPNTVVLPIVDLIHPFNFEYSKAMVTKSGFDWSLIFKWTYIPWEYFDTPENNVKPIESPAMPGGLLAIRRDYFKTLGEYDMGLEIWGSENIELSLKTWMCGGRILVAPCSRIGHVFRYRRPYKGKPFMDTTVHNAARVAKTWLGEHAKHFFRARGISASTDVGDISEGLALKKKLDCKDMDWYLKNVYPDLKIPDYRHEEL